MVYVFVLIALLSLTVKGYCGKKTSIYAENTGDSFLFNLLRMIFCVGIGLAVIFAETAQHDLNPEKNMLLICLFAGASNAVFLIAWLLAVQRNAMVTVDVTLTVGSIIPAGLCAWLFGESLSWSKMLGFLLIILAAVILSGYHRETGKKRTLAGVLLLLSAAIGDGLSGFSQQLYKQYYTENGRYAQTIYYPNSIYQFYTFVFSALILLTVFVLYACRRYFKMPSRHILPYIKETLRPLAKPLPYIFVMAVCLFASNYFQTMAASKYGMPSQILYPFLKGGCLITVNITAMLFFGERPTKRSILGSLTALAGMIAMNIL